MKSIPHWVAFLWILILSFVGFSSRNCFAATDDVTCWVKNDCDEAGSIDAFNCLRHKIENGYNKIVQRACVDQIIIHNDISNITLKKPLVIDNERDEDCEGDSPLCGDGLSLLIKGNDAVIDVQGISGECAITIKSRGVKLTELKILATTAQIEANQVICDEGGGNELDVTVNGGDLGPAQPAPSASPTPTPTPIPPPQPPLGPSDLTAELTGSAPNYEVKLNWQDNSRDETGFRLEKAMVAEGGTDCGSFSPLTELGANVNIGTDRAVTAGETYCYRVLATKGDLDSASSNVVQMTIPEVEPPTPPTAPTDLAAITVDDESIRLTWSFDETVDIAGFRLERGNEACAEPSFTLAALLPKEAREYTDTGLTPETTYCYRLQTYLVAPAAANSDYSATASATTVEDNGIPPVDPTDIDGDTILNDLDNCPEEANAGQEDLDGDDKGNACDDDSDGDGVGNDEENARGTDPLDPDSDDDGPTDDTDNCPALANAGQEDNDGDHIGDVCDTTQNLADLDGDSVPNDSDNCPQMSNPDQGDEDEDGLGDACDLAPAESPTRSGGCSLSQTGTGISNLIPILFAVFFLVRIRRSS